MLRAGDTPRWAGLGEFVGHAALMLDMTEGRQEPAAEIGEPDTLDPTDRLVVEQGPADKVVVQPESPRDGSVVGDPHQPERVQDEEVRRGVVRHITIVGSRNGADGAQVSDRGPG